MNKGLLDYYTKRIAEEIKKDLDCIRNDDMLLARMEELEGQVGEVEALANAKKTVPITVTLAYSKYVHANEAHTSLFGKVYGNGALRFTEEYVTCSGAKQVNLLTCYRSNDTENFGLVFYDADKKPIAGYLFPIRDVDAYDTTYEVPENAEYFRTCIHNEYAADFYVNLIVDAPVGEVLEEEISRAKEAEAKIDARIDALSTENDDVVGSVLFEETVEQGVAFKDYYYLYANEGAANLFGKTYGGAGWSYIDYVPCDKANAVNVLINRLDSATAGRGFVFYDADKNPIKGYVFPTGDEGTLDMTYEVPENAAFFRTTIKTEYKQIFYANLVVDTDIKTELYEEISRAKEAEATLEAKVSRLHTLADKKVLIIGDSISTDSNSTGINYGNYEKWVIKLIKQGFFSADKVTNDSIHATGFVSSLSGDGTDCFLPRLQAVENPSEYAIVIIFGGINDYIRRTDSSGNVVIYYNDFTTAVDTFFEYLTDTFVNARICVLRPLRTSDINQTSEGKQQIDYSDYINTVAKSYCLPVLNLTEESGFYPWKPDFKNRWTFTGWTGGDGVTGDGVHPSEEWQETRLVPMIKQFLKSLIE